MRSHAKPSFIVGAAVVASLLWAGTAHAQIPIGTWARTDTDGKGIAMTVTTCCNGGLRLVYKIPPHERQPAMTLTVDSPMDGTDVPALLNGQPTGETMAIKRVDERHYAAVVKMKGQPFTTSTATVSADQKTITVESVSQEGGHSKKTTETWVRQ
jgi:hypothetical protein